MSLIDSINKSKKRYKNINNFTTASASTNYSSDGVNLFTLNLDGIFKMVIITCLGDVTILPTQYIGLSIKKGKNKIIVTNFNKVDLENNILFQFIGALNVESVRVYRWGKFSQLAKLTQFLPRTMSKEENTIENHDEKMGESALRSSEADAFQMGMNTLRNSTEEQKVITGLYTKGNKFILDSKFYVGNYHYHTDTKEFMTGHEHTPNSKVLKKMSKIKLRRRNGI
tara:strand:- start:595 stop:1272 length:678 start_codon:yes stop_codon:yes gene_type:complete